MASGLSLTLPGRPVPWARVRRGSKGQAFTPLKQKAHRTELAWMLKAAAGGKKWNGPVAINVTFDYENRTTSIVLTDAIGPGRTERPDLDNLCKQVMEALEESGIIEDDSQVVFITARKV